LKTVSFVAAASNSGKTTLIEKLVLQLKAKGLRVAVVKHSSAGFDLDKPGKDSWRFQQAGADAVVLVSPERMAIIKTLEREPTPEEIERLALGADIIIHEGFKKTAKNKIEVFRHGISGERPICLDGSGFIALVSDKPFALPIPRFDINDVEGITSFLLSHPEDQ